MSNQVEYQTVFNRLCHMVALSKEGKIKPAVDNLVVTALAIDGRALTNVAQVSEAIEAYFSLSLSNSLVQSSIDRNLNNNRLMRHDSSKALILPPQVRTEISLIGFVWRSRMPKMKLVSRKRVRGDRSPRR